MKFMCMPNLSPFVIAAVLVAGVASDEASALESF